MSKRTFGLNYPCDINLLSQNYLSENLPQLFLHGEKHAYSLVPNKKIDFKQELSKSYHEVLTSQFQKKEIILGVEGSSPSHISGIPLEDREIYAIGGLLGYSKFVVNEYLLKMYPGKTSTPVIENYLELLRFLPELEKYSKKFTLNSQKGKELVTLIYKSNQNQLNTIAVKDIIYVSIVSMFGLFKLVQTPEYKKYNIDPIKILDYAKQLSSFKNFQNNDWYLIDLRNQLMTIKISKLYCDGLKQGKDVHIIIGQEHAEGIEKILKKSQFNIPIIVNNSWDQMKNMLKAFSSLERHFFNGEISLKCLSEMHPTLIKDSHRKRDIIKAIKNQKDYQVAWKLFLKIKKDLYGNNREVKIIENYYKNTGTLTLGLEVPLQLIPSLGKGDMVAFDDRVRESYNAIESEISLHSLLRVGLNSKFITPDERSPVSVLDFTTSIHK